MHLFPISDLKSSPVPRGVVVRGPLQVPKLDLIGGLGVPHTGRELHLQKLVGLMPVHLGGGVGWGEKGKVAHKLGAAHPHKPHLGTRPTILTPATSVWKRT